MAFVLSKRHFFVRMDSTTLRWCSHPFDYTTFRSGRTPNQTTLSELARRMCHHERWYKKCVRPEWSECNERNRTGTNANHHLNFTLCPRKTRSLVCANFLPKSKSNSDNRCSLPSVRINGSIPLNLHSIFKSKSTATTSK